MITVDEKIKPLQRITDHVAVYSGTRNVYPQMYTSLKSLLLNTDMDRVYLLIEDDDFPFPVPENVLTMNVKSQDFFLPGGANYNTPYSYMELLRCAMSNILTEEKKVLWLDIDTIVIDDIADLFETDMEGFFYAGAIEPAKCRNIFTYINAGVVLINCEALRESGKEFELIAFLNTYPYDYPGQDVINLLCQGRIRQISSEYNSNDWVVPCARPRIIHYAAMKPEEYKKKWAYKKYEAVKLGEDEDE